MAMRPWDPLWEEAVSGGKRLLAYFQCALLFVLFARARTSDHFVGRDDGPTASLVLGDVMNRNEWFLGIGGATDDTENETASGELLQKELECRACEYDINATAREENAAARGGPKRRQPAAILDVIDIGNPTMAF